MLQDTSSFPRVGAALIIVAVALVGVAPLRLVAMPAPPAPPAPPVPVAAPAAARMQLKDTRHHAEQQRVREVLESVNGDQRQACEILGISRATLWRRMKG